MHAPFDTEKTNAVHTTAAQGTAARTAAPTLPEIDAWEAKLAPLDPMERLRLICLNFQTNIRFSTSLGKEDQVITAMIAAAQLPIQIFSLDTGRLFEETYALYDRTQARYGLTMQVYFPDPDDIQDLIAEQGMQGFYASVEQRKACCHVRKVKPLEKALTGASVWITGLRASQSESRQKLPCIEWDAHYQLWKMHPLLDWTEEALDHYIERNQVPTNPLHEQGFPSIGCAPCTRAVAPGESSRAGRWWWENSNKECGLHQHKTQ
jgi:phosphoadenosine phosphosulfate reductase